MLCYVNYKRVKKPLRIPNLEVEIGFGRGDFIVKLAKENPEKNFFGIELSQVSVEKLMRRVQREGLKNVFCTRIDAYWGFYLLFEDESVFNIYMNYPDPWFKKRHHKRRLTTPERLYVFTKRLKTGGRIEIRSDDYDFIRFSEESASFLGCFDISLEELSVREPLTKYEEKWLREGRKLYRLILLKRGEPRFVPHPTIREVEALFPEKVKAKRNKFGELENREFKLGQSVYLKTFKLWEREEGFLIECLLTESGYYQKFFVQAKRKGEDEWVLDVSPYSEVLKTENLQRAIRELGKALQA
ncbi:MAG: tRNA (guanosine(46)-N7)-methyltransferase TrmB [Aquificae bacterium]|nr:tRNA (guanosine(46)-N7)-methyltransferase TrmB [Aquificota bacterium]